MSTVTTLDKLSPRQRKYIEHSSFLNTLYESVHTQGNENKSALTILIESAKCSSYPESIMLLDHGGHMMTVAQLIQFYDPVIGRAQRCPKCNNSVGEGMILAHLQDGYDEGHNLTVSEIVEAFVNAEEP